MIIAITKPTNIGSISLGIGVSTNTFLIKYQIVLERKAVIISREIILFETLSFG